MRSASRYDKPEARKNAKQDLERMRASHRPVFLLRGTPEWDAREEARRAKGCKCLSFGPIPPDGGQLRDRDWKRYARGMH